MLVRLYTGNKGYLDALHALGQLWAGQEVELTVDAEIAAVETGLITRGAEPW